MKASPWSERQKPDFERFTVFFFTFKQQWIRATTSSTERNKRLDIHTVMHQNTMAHKQWLNIWFICVRHPKKEPRFFLKKFVAFI